MQTPWLCSGPCGPGRWGQAWSKLTPGHTGDTGGSITCLAAALALQLLFQGLLPKNMSRGGHWRRAFQTLNRAWQVRFSFFFLVTPQLGGSHSSALK